MTIERAIIKNYRTLRAAGIKYSDALNIVVGDNESGKSTLLKAVAYPLFEARLSDGFRCRHDQH